MMRVFLAVFLSIVVLEILLRIIGFGNPPTVVLDSDIEYYVTPNKKFSRFNNEITTNRYGMRSDDFDKDGANTPKVFIFGDSIVYGNHHIDQKDTIAYNMQSTISERGGVAALAASSWGPENIRQYFEKIGPFTGEYAIIVQSTHDRYDHPFDSSDIIPYRKRSTYLALEDAFIFIYERLARKIFKKPGSEAIDRGDTSDELLQMILLVKENFKHTLLVHHATIPELLNQDKEVPGEKYLRAISEKSGVDYFPLRPYISAQCSAGDLYRDEIHLTATGSECVSKALVGWIKKHTSTDLVQLVF